MTKNKRLLLIGCGDIPQRLIAKLPESYKNISALRRSPHHLPGVNCLTGDASNRHDLARALAARPDDILITLTPDQRTAQAYRRTYFQSVHRLLEVLDEDGLSPHIWFVSSTSVYGENRGGPVDEQSATGGDSETANLLCETERLLFESGQNASILRCSGIYGPGRTRMIDNIRAEKFAAGNSWTNRIHSEDVASAIAFLLQLTSPPDVVLLSDTCPVARFEFENWLAERLGKKPVHEPGDPQEGKRCDSGKLQSLGFRFHYPDYRSGYEALIQGL